MLGFEPITSERADKGCIARLEQKFGCALPDSYRRFLIEFNGGKPERRVFTFIERGRESVAAIRYFYADCDSRAYSIEEKLRIYSGRIPEGYLPIACDSFGNLLLLSVSAQHHGEIYFWNHERELSRPGPGDMHRVAAFFEELIANLKERHE
jgi:SMI1 / KNR4 family (SUKH-1)